MALNKKKVQPKKIMFPVVGIGASAGGLEAFTELIKNLPPNTGMAFVLVQHLDPTHKSMLTEIISRVTKMPTVEVKNRMPIKSDHVYIIPPNKNMTLAGEKFSLVSRKETVGVHLPIDCFFSSLAKNRGHQAIGIILSGAASDGASGQKAIKVHGGITFSQDLGSAKQDSMPRSAIASGCIDYILRPKAIANKLVTLSKHSPLKETEKEKIEKVLSSTKDDLQKIFVLLKYYTGLDLAFYKKATVERRIKRRLDVTKKETVKKYLRYLRNNPVEVEALFQDLLINVTNFFRDPKLFETLQKKIIPAILKQKSADKSVRIWVPACSTGEEAYSLAICLLESLGKKAGDFSIQVFATDVNESVIRKARRGLYPASIKADVSASILRRYFIKDEQGYRINKAVRDICIFASQDLTRDPPFSKMDLVSCRNMLIYIDQKLQKKIVSLFHYSLNPSGILVLGSAETVSSFTELFKTVDKKFKIYAKKELSVRPNMNFDPAHYPAEKIAMVKTSSVARKKESNLLEATDESSQARDEELRSALEEIQSANEELQSSNEELETSKEELQATNEELVTLNDELSNRNSELSVLNSDILNLFKSTRLPVIMVGRDLCVRRFTPMAHKVLNLIPSDIGRKITDINPSIKVPDLARILLDTIDHLTIVEMEVRDQEGHWFSMTVNPYKTVDNKIDGAVIALFDIHTIKIAQEQCAAAGEYFKSIVEAVPEPLIVLDKNLCVMTANKSFYRQFKVSPKHTQGQFIYNLGNRQWDMPELRRMFKKVLTKKTPVNDFEITHKFPRIGKRVMLLNARVLASDISGERMILVGIKDITESKQAEEDLRLAKEAAEAANRFKTDFLTNVSHDLRTPLNAILGFAHVLKSVDMPEQYSKSVGFINECGKQLLSLVDDILDVSKIDSQKIKLKNEEFDLQKLLENSLEAARSGLGEKDISVTLSVNGPLPPMKGDSHHVQRVIDNLLSNAVKYTEQGTIKVTVHCDTEPSDNDKKRVRISVKDTGFGINAEALPNIFDSFSRFHEFYKGETYTGAGLGLHIVKNLVSLMGGEIRVSSEVGKGSEFIVTLNFDTVS
jgi:two-component system, chemotaxis family, CheB/CheR fusion protein